MCSLDSIYIIMSEKALITDIYGSRNSLTKKVDGLLDKGSNSNVLLQVKASSPSPTVCDVPPGLRFDGFQEFREVLIADSQHGFQDGYHVRVLQHRVLVLSADFIHLSGDNVEQTGYCQTQAVVKCSVIAPR